jgi:hypothetical protein
MSANVFGNICLKQIWARGLLLPYLTAHPTEYENDYMCVGTA